MKKIVLPFLFAMALFSNGFAQKPLMTPTEVRPAKDFHAIEVSSAFDVYLTQSNEESVAVSASEVKYRGQK
jgi:hypothetical protein